MFESLVFTHSHLDDRELCHLATSTWSVRLRQKSSEWC